MLKAIIIENSVGFQPNTMNELLLKKIKAIEFYFKILSLKYLDKSGGILHSLVLCFIGIISCEEIFLFSFYFVKCL